ncbi:MULTISPECIES: glycosyltransferase family 2 protein [Salinibaculum]|uniref:glycosyltransferase family 2 protein n=1 Tax=Salinibaculum TaxID=2732368 RepID=UPI0030CFB775
MASIESGRSDGKGTVASREKFSNILVGIPAYNEEIAIGSIVLSVRTLTDNVLVIDDGSGDATANIAREAGATVICHNVNRGKGAAIQTIFTQFQNGEYDGMVLLDGDGQHVPRDIRSVAKPIVEHECDMVIGSRYIDQNKTETPLYRRLGQKVLDFATAGSSGKSVSDSQSGFRALSPTAIEELSITTNGYGVESEMISAAMDEDLEIKEVPIDVKYREVDGQNSNPLRHGLSVLVVVLQLIRNQHPLVFFGVPGLFALILGGVIAGHSAMLYQSTSIFPQWRLLISLFSIIVGTLCLFSAVVLNQILDMMKES